MLHEGPVPAELDAEGLLEVRARFLASRGWIDLEAARADLAHRDATLAAADGEVVLWFEHDLTISFNSSTSWSASPIAVKYRPA